MLVRFTSRKPALSCVNAGDDRVSGLLPVTGGPGRHVPSKVCGHSPRRVCCGVLAADTVRRGRSVTSRSLYVTKLVRHKVCTSRSLYVTNLELQPTAVVMAVVVKALFLAKRPHHQLIFFLSLFLNLPNRSEVLNGGGGGAATGAKSPHHASPYHQHQQERNLSATNRQRCRMSGRANVCRGRGRVASWL